MNNFGTTFGEQVPGQDSLAAEKPFDFSAEHKVFKALLEKHSEETQRCAQRRALRKNRQNVVDLREKKLLLADETIIPDRTIEQNIQAEKPIFLNYVEQPTTTISFTDSQFPAQNFEPLEQFFTRLCRYSGWKSPWHKLIDSIQVHGVGYLEVLFDTTKEGKFTLEYVRREHVIHPPKARDLQSCSHVIRKYELTKERFRVFAQRFEFSSSVVSDILKHYENQEVFVEIYKMYLRSKDGVLHIAWLGPEPVSADTWLKAPQPHFLGDLQPNVDPTTNQPAEPTPLPTKTLPIFAFPYSIEEDEVLQEIPGRVALDSHVQSAMTALLSATVNGAHRASQFFPTRKPSPAQMTADQPSNQELFVLKHGHVYDGDFTITSIPWPNQIALTVAQMLSVRNAQSLGNTDFAAMSRNDTAKRATEIVAAQQQASQLNSVKISLFSQSSLAVYALCWRIVQNQLVIGGLQLPAEVQAAQINPISPTLILAMSADAQVVEREQRITKYMQFLGLTQGTKFQEPVFRRLLQTAFPAEFPMWEQEVGQMSARDQLLSQFADFVMQIPAETLSSPQQQMMYQLIQQAEAMLVPVNPSGEPITTPPPM